jgi:GTP cyclohydrolase I
MNGHETQMSTVLKEEIQQRLESEELLERFGLDRKPVDIEAAKSAISDLLYAIGEDASRAGLLDTPKRVAKAYEELVGGYTTDPVELINNAIFDIDYDDIVTVNDIAFYSLCEHHLLPFIGHAHVAYIPCGRVVGLSKIPRIVDMFSRRLQVQERLTQQIASFLDEILQPRGVAVAMTGKHMCSMIRGVKKHDTNLTTSSYIGEFKTDRHLRQEFVLRMQRSDIV